MNRWPGATRIDWRLIPFGILTEQYVGKQLELGDSLRSCLLGTLTAETGYSVGLHMNIQGRKPSILGAGSSAADSRLPLSCLPSCNPKARHGPEHPLLCRVAAEVWAHNAQMISVLILTLHICWNQDWEGSQSRFLSLASHHGSLLEVGRGSRGVACQDATERLSSDSRFVNRLRAGLPLYGEVTYMGVLGWGLPVNFFGIGKSTPQSLVRTVKLPAYVLFLLPRKLTGS